MKLTTFSSRLTEIKFIIFEIASFVIFLVCLFAFVAYELGVKLGM